MKSGGGGVVARVLLEGTEPTMWAFGRSDRASQVEGNMVTCFVFRATLERIGGQCIMDSSFDIEYKYNLETVIVTECCFASNQALKHAL
jgi:hypothetical protein